jgi:hypothetical protein
LSELKSSPMTDRRYFREVCDSPSFQSLLLREGLHSTGPHSLRANQAVVIYRSSKQWVLAPDDKETVCVHIELRKRGTVNVDVELYPYKSFREPVSFEEALKTPLLTTKATLVSALRPEFNVSSVLELDSRRYLAPWRSNSLMIAKFRVCDDDADVNTYICSLMPVVHELATIIDRVIPAFRAKSNRCGG